MLGPRQAGKTTLALAIAKSQPSTYLDLESRAHRARLEDAASYPREHEDELVVLDEVQRMPELFQELRGLIDEGRQCGRKAGRFLLLGSASPDLIRQSETLAGRNAYVELPPLGILGVADSQANQLWLRGGFPESFLSDTDSISLDWRLDFVRTYLERDIPQLGPRIPAETLHRFWTMLSQVQGGILNAAQLARGLAVDGKTIARYLDLLVDLLLVRRLQPHASNAGKRLVKSPRVFVRDSGIVHALLNIVDRDALLSHPVAGASWEGFVIENPIAAAPQHSVPYYYRTAAGAEIDLLLEVPGRGLWAFDIKRSAAANPVKGFFAACEDLNPARRFLVNAASGRDRLRADLEMAGVAQAALELSSS